CRQRLDEARLVRLELKRTRSEFRGLLVAALVAFSSRQRARKLDYFARIVRRLVLKRLVRLRRMHKITPGEVRLGLKHQRTWQERLQIEDMRGELRCVCVLVCFDRMGGEIQRKVHDALGLPGVSLQQT